MLKKSLDFLDKQKSKPIDLSGLQHIINHVSEEYDSLENVKFRYFVENPENNQKIIFGIIDHEFIEEFNMISFKTEKRIKSYSKISENPKIEEAEIDEERVYSIHDLNYLLTEIKKENSNWSDISINIENLFFPNMYCIKNESVYVRIGDLNES